MDALNLFKNQQYLNLETFRKTGMGVKTPVWFVEVKDELCFITEAESAKVKRMRNNPSVKVAPCKMDGTVIGDWAPATIRFMLEDEINEVDRLYNRKYGLIKLLFELPKTFKKKPARSVIAIRPNF